MKKIFTLALVAALALAANAGMPQKKEFNPAGVKAEPFTKELKAHKHAPKFLSNEISRADEETEVGLVNGTNEVICNYYNFNAPDDYPFWGYATTVEINEETGEVLFNDLFEYPVVMTGTLAKDGDNTIIEVPMGQMVGEVTTQSGVTYEFKVSTYKSDISQKLLDDYTVVFKVYNNGVVSTDQIYLVGRKKGSADWDGWYEASGYTCYLFPNATFEFDTTNKNWADYEGYPELSTRIYAEVYEFDDDEIEDTEDPDVAYIMLSYVTPFQSGSNVMFYVTESDYIYCQDEVGYWQLNGYDNSGNPDFTMLYVVSWTGEGNIAGPFIDEVEATKTGIEWGNWGLFTYPENPRGFGYSTYGRLILDNATPGEDNPDEPGDAINTISADNSNAPVEYFNLQGVRVANPAAGSIVIRRQGNEASKLFVK